ncbi:hypothetical protein [Streptomyces sp. NPDC053048]|uniref:hypothetical protein n=1 Tax=Streptomyces sp. NPDC053048 TaxID=3365694 RepID=UPI0037CD4616
MYRKGAYVVDVREDKIAQVIGGTGGRVQLQSPDGSLQWEVPFAALRLATSAEREAAGLRPYLGTCPECVELAARRRTAPPELRGRATADAHLHWIKAHSTPEPAPEANR